MTVQLSLSMVAMLVSLFAFAQYAQSILKGRTLAHPLSWTIWGISTCVIFAAQISGGAGYGAWAIGVSGLAALSIALLSIKGRGSVSVHRLDIACLVAALVSLPIWYITNDPLWAVVLITFVDSLGFIPTLRKAYQLPYSEPITFHLLMGLRGVLVIAALEHYSVTTLLFPLTVSVFCGLLISLLLMQRRKQTLSF